MDEDVCDPETDARPQVSAEAVRKDVAPFLSKHLPRQYAPQGHPDRQNRHQQVASEKGNTRYCYRHRPDLKCRRPADEPTMDQLQSNMENLPAADQQAISHVWSLFSAAPASMRKMMLQGILQQCCFPQLSFLSSSLRELIRIDFMHALPTELSFKILGYLDTASLCKAAQVSRRWRMLADDDVVWHNMCEQHINRKCDKCGWGLPLLDRQRLRATKRQMELRGKQSQNFSTGEITEGTNKLNINGKRPPSDPEQVVEEVAASPAKRTCADERRRRPWKDVYSERYKVESNWRRGRCTERVFKGHTDGIMALQFDDSILATGSYDNTIKIWDIDTGEERRTLTGHTSGIRALQFDNTKLISASLDKTLKVWNYRTGACVATLRGHTEGVLSVHFDGPLIASGSVDKSIILWNFEDKSKTTLTGHEDWVNHVRIDSESSTLFSASDDGTVKMWDLATRSCIRTFGGEGGHVGPVQQVLLEPDMLQYVSPAEGSASPREHDVTSPYRDPPTPPSSQRTSHPNTIITASLDNNIKVWDVKTGRCVRTLFGHVEGVWGLAADTFRIVTGAQDRMVKVWDVKTGRCQRTITGPTAPVTCVGLSDSRMVTAGEDMIARMYCFKAADMMPKGVVGEEGDGCGTS